MARRIEAVLGCSFHEGDNHGIPAWLTSFLGMRVVLDEWRGIDEAPIFRMSGDIRGDLVASAHRAGDTFSFANISQGVIDVLEMSGAGKWRLPSAPETEAELAWMKKVDRDDY